MRHVNTHASGLDRHMRHYTYVDAAMDHRHLAPAELRAKVREARMEECPYQYRYTPLRNRLRASA